MSFSREKNRAWPGCGGRACWGRRWWGEGGCSRLGRGDPRSLAAPGPAPRSDGRAALARWASPLHCHPAAPSWPSVSGGVGQPGRGRPLRLHDPVRR